MRKKGDAGHKRLFTRIPHRMAIRLGRKDFQAGEVKSPGGFSESRQPRKRLFLAERGVGVFQISPCFEEMEYE